ncbi:MAG: helix-turn-helix transcriptional regulator, partial [Candidatus Bathyarchaeia archaeon]
TKVAILSVLNRENLHGYGIWGELKKRFKIRITPSGVYQHLTELEMAGMLKKCRVERLEGKPERIYYTLTEKGKKALIELTRP